LLGGRDNVAALAAKRLLSFNSSIEFRFSNGLTSVRDPDPLQEATILKDINAFQPDFLFVAYGHPWQDLWINEHRLDAAYSVAVGVGGAFDYIAGRISRAPVWMQGIGLEWLYRVLREPRRVMRIFRATFVFIRLVVTSS
jgi:N-acetylglucosaminyldiphosphoundecaprenol N-acetyl-beta-D-mannosaminyltransferase